MATLPILPVMARMKMPAGRLRPLAVTSPIRLSLLPDVRAKRVGQLGGNYRGGTAEVFGTMVTTEIERRVHLIKRLGLTAD